MVVTRIKVRRKNEHDSFHGFDATGTYLLAYAMPLKKIRLTGAGKSVVPNLNSVAAESLIADGRGWDTIKTATAAYDQLTVDQLVERSAVGAGLFEERARWLWAVAKKCLLQP